MPKPLVQAVEDLSAAGYVVLTSEQGEETAALLGALAFDDPDAEKVAERAQALLETWPVSFQDDAPAKEPS